MEFVIPIKAIGKERARKSRFGKFLYTPQKTKEFEATVFAYALHHMRHNKTKMIEGPVSVDLLVKMKVPKSWSRKRRLEALDGHILPTVTPDLDNILKSLYDGLEGAIFNNDRQVVQGSQKKIYSEDEEMIIKVESVQPVRV